MKEIRVGRHRVCPKCGSHKLVRRKRGLVTRTYVCKRCDTRFKGIKVLRLRVSWR